MAEHPHAPRTTLLHRTSLACAVAFAALTACAPMSFCPDGGRCVSFDDYCAELATVAGCRQARSCGLLPPTTDCGSGVDACSATLRAALASGALRFDSPKAGSCLSGDCAACAVMFKPANEQGCATHEACGSARFCDLRNGCPGTCRGKLSVGSEVLTPRGCASGAALSLGADRYRCVTPVTVGQPCDATVLGSPCAAGASCVPQDGGTRCVAQAAPGAACDVGSPCPFEHQCVAGRCARNALAGEPCGDAVARCVSSLACVDGRCAQLAEGQRCDVAAACVASAFCAQPGPVCTARAALGEACSDARACVTGAACVNDVCTTPRQAGEPCDERRPCATGLRCDEASCRAPACWAP